AVGGRPGQSRASHRSHGRRAPAVTTPTRNVGYVQKFRARASRRANTRRATATVTIRRTSNRIVPRGSGGDRDERCARYARIAATRTTIKDANRASAEETDRRSSSPRYAA